MYTFSSLGFILGPAGLVFALSAISKVSQLKKDVEELKQEVEKLKSQAEPKS